MAVQIRVRMAEFASGLESLVQRRVAIYGGGDFERYNYGGRLAGAEKKR